MSNRFNADFWRSESGAVTVDWVVLTAGAVGLAMATLAVVSGGVEDLTGETQLALAEIDPGEPLFGSFDVGGWGNNPLLNTSGVTAQGYANWTGGYSDDELVEVYNAYHAGAHPTMLDPGDRVDSIGALESEMNGRDIDIPAGNPSYDDLYAGYTG